MSKIRILPKNLVNQIAAGEIIERPFSIIKELVENSIDAAASKIEITIKAGGKSFISIVDNGEGMTKEDLAVCLKPHSTSKLKGDDLFNISTLGFRGEALASIASVSRMTISSKYRGASSGFQIICKNGLEENISSNSIVEGTAIHVSDLFNSVPARLNFLKSDASESGHCYKCLKQIAIANPHIAFKLDNNNKTVFSYHSSGKTHEQYLENRILQILGQDFLDNSIVVENSNPMFRMYGRIAVPTYSKHNTEDQYVVINGRALRDKMLMAAIKFAYSDILFSGKYPCYAIFIEIKNSEIDVNVSPTKSDIRFKDYNFVRHIIVNTLKSALNNKIEQKTSSTLATSLLHSHRQQNYLNTPLKNLDMHLFAHNDHSTSNNNSILMDEEDHHYQEDTPLGFAKAQVHKNWIIAQNSDGIIIVDQHAAHERVVQESLKKNYANTTVVKQILLTPEIITLQEDDLHIIQMYKDKISLLGINFDTFGENVIVVKEIPSILGNINPKELVLSIISDLKKVAHVTNFHNLLNQIISTIACHSSIRYGRIMNVREMNDLLRTMEKTENYAQCSHGRPTYINIKMKDIEKLFSKT